MTSTAHSNNADGGAGGYNGGMAKRLDFTKLPRSVPTTQIGDEDDAETPFWRIRKRHRTAIQRDHPNLPPSTVEQMLRRRMARGNRSYRS